MNPKFLLSLSILSAGLILSQAPLRADDATPPPPQPPAADAPPADGQTPPPPHRHGRRPLSLAELTAKLNLTADQQKTIGPILENAKSQGKALRDDDSMSQEDKRAKMKEIMTTSRAQIRAALTADQQKIFDAMGERGGKGGQGSPETAAPAAPAAPAGQQ
jgi:Spy/CpxP family protein refolding chaperone